MNFLKGTFVRLVILILCCSFGLNAQTHISYNVSGSSINIDVRSGDPSYKTVEFNSRNFVIPKIKGSLNFTEEIGVPEEYYIAKNIIVPGEGDYELEILNASYTDVQGNMIPNSIFGGQEYSTRTAYKPYIADYAAIEYLGLQRGEHIARLMIKAAFQEPNSNIVKFVKQFKAKITLKNTEATNTSGLSNMSGMAPDVLNPVHFGKWKSKYNNVNKSFNYKNDKLLGESPVQQAVKIKVAEDGIYRLSAEKISSLGINIPNEAINSIKLLGTGGKPIDESIIGSENNKAVEQEIIVRTESDGRLKDITFFGKAANGFEYDVDTKEISHYINHFSNSNYYILSWGGGEGKRVKALSPPQGDIQNRPSTYIHRIFEEEELVNAYAVGGGRQWFGRSFFDAPFVNKLYNLVREGEIFYKVNLGHTAGENGLFEIFENNQKVDEFSIYSVTADYVHARTVLSEFSIPATQIESDNRSVLKIKYTNQYDPTGSTPYFDYYEIHYPRSFVAIENELSFMADTSFRGISEFTVNGFQGEEIFGFDISDTKNPKLLTNLSTTGGIYKFRSEYNEENKGAYYISSKIRVPDVESTEFAGLSDSKYNKDVILITHPNLIESAKEFKSYREANSDLSIGIFTVDHIYNEFGAGVPDIAAIRNFISNAYHYWDVRPEYVILWGDGHFDYKNITSKAVNFVPPFESLDDTNYFDELNSVVSDDYYVQVDGDDLLIDLAIGRVTIASDAEGKAAVEKINHYENNSSNDQWRNNVLLLADDSKVGNKNPDGAVHVIQSEDLARDYIPQDMNIEKMYLVKYPTQYLENGRRKPELTQDMLKNINNNGSLLLNWVGHGNPRVWAHEAILEREKTIPEMLNYDKLFFLTAATCDYGRFDNPSTQSGAEVMFSSNEGGSIGSFTAARIVLSSSNADLNERYYNQLFSRNEQTGRYNTLGEAYYKVKSLRNSTNDRKFFLLGDPTMRILIPHYQVRIDSINGLAINEVDTVMNFKALSEVSIQASIIDPAGNTIDNTFNGSAIITILDGDEYIKMIDEDSGHLFEFTEFGGALSRSSHKVENGKINGALIIPKDISYSDVKGRMFVFAGSDDNRFAKGNFNEFNVNGIVTNVQNDGQGPDISIFLDSRKFEKGGLVSKNPLLIVDLFDETAINTTGLGIGHRIEAWIDDNPQPINLTDNFSTSLSDSRYGSVIDKLYGLEKGKHVIKIRAWDIYNNYTIEESEFYINPDDEDYVIYDAVVFPNPFSETTTLEFSHNIEPPFFSKVEVYDSNGRLIKSLDNTMTTLSSALAVWDGTDNHGVPVPQGTYFIAIHVFDDLSEGVKKGVKAVFIR